MKRSNQNVDVCTIPATGSVSGLKVTEREGITIEFDSGPVTIVDSHSQDCCEHVYAEWEQLELHMNDILSRGPYTGLTIKGVPEMGILLVFKRDVRSLKILVPCYNEQNGYYSSNLDLHITHADETTDYDISNYTEFVER